MENIAEFKKMFKLNVPIHKHFDYYIKTLMKSEFYAGIGKLAKEFEQYEIDVAEQGIYQNVKSYKLDYAHPKATEFLKGTDAFNSLMNADLKKGLRKKDILRKRDGNWMLSIDFKQANFNALKTFDHSGELPASWEELCISLDIHPTLAKSKSFRQYVFGSASKSLPGRVASVQHSNILTIVECLISDYDVEEDDVVFISDDEFIIQLPPDHKLAVGKIRNILNWVGTITKNEGITMPTHYKVIKNEKITKDGHELKEMCVQKHYTVKLTGLSEKYKTLFKVPGSKFYKYFKTHVLEEPLDQRDLMFMNDGEIAIWSEGEDSIAETIIPEGEMSMEEIQRDYPYFLKKLSEEVPGLSERQKRKIINVSLSLCMACHNDDVGCQCWNDE